MTVVENLRSFGYTAPGGRRAFERKVDECLEVFPRLGERRNSLAAQLSGGEQQMLGLSKALILQPRLLVIDELSLGLAPVIVGQLLEMVKRINAEGTAVVLVEQSVNIALNLVDHAYFMEKGEMKFDGRAKDLLGRDDLLRAVFLAGAGSQDGSREHPPRGSRGVHGPSRRRRPAARYRLLPIGHDRRPRRRGRGGGGAARAARGAAGPHRPAPRDAAARRHLLGVIIGMTYGLLSVGLVLIYRTNKIINFAHGQIGAFGAAFFGVAAVKWGLPYWLAFAVALAVTAAVGYGTEATVVRRLRNAPKLMSIVATLGVGQFLLVFALVINSTAAAGTTYPLPAGMPTFNVGALVVTPAYAAMLILSPLVVHRHRVVPPDAASTAWRCERPRPTPRPRGWPASSPGGCPGSPGRSPAALSAFSAILTQPTLGFTAGDAFGPALLLRALAGAVHRPDDVDPGRARCRDRARASSSSA